MEEIKDNLIKFGKSVTKASTKLINNTKLNLKLTSEEEKIKKIYIEIGKKVHEIYSYGGNIGKFFDEKYMKIVEAEERIKEIKKKIEIEKEKPYLSEKEDNINISEEMNEHKVNDILLLEEDKICNFCGEKNNINDKFCLKCGRYI